MYVCMYVCVYTRPSNATYPYDMSYNNYMPQYGPVPAYGYSPYEQHVPPYMQLVYALPYLSTEDRNVPPSPIPYIGSEDTAPCDTSPYQFPIPPAQDYVHDGNDRNDEGLYKNERVVIEHSAKPSLAP